MPEPKVTQHVFPISHGRAGAPIGTRDWADSLRLSLVAMVDRLGEEDDRLLSYLEFAKKHRAWTLMNKPDGSFFSTIEEFCAFRRPYGLGKSWTELRPFLVAAMAKRGTPHDEIERTLQLESVPEPMSIAESVRKAAIARHAKTGKDATRHDVGTQERARVLDAHPPAKAASTESPATRHDVGTQEKVDHRMAERLRAINRAPESVRDAYREGRISQTLAAKLGPKNPTPDTAAHIAEIAAKIRQVPDRKVVDTIVRDRLGAPTPTPVDRAVRAVERLTSEQRAEFFRRVAPLHTNTGEGVAQE